MKHYEALLKKRCFSWTDACNIAGNPNTAGSLLQSYLKKGFIKRVKRDLYVAINLANGEPVANRFVIASNITPGSYVSYHSAFSYYGYFNQVFYDVYVSSATKFNSFHFEGLKYYYVNSRMERGVVTYSDGVSVTNLERTIIDSIDAFEKIGGLDELLQCLSLIPYADEKKLQLYLDHYGKQVLYQKTGYILEQFKDDLRLSPDFFNYCASRVGQSIRYLYRNVKHFNPEFNKRWQLYVPGNLLNVLREGGPDEYV